MPPCFVNEKKWMNKFFFKHSDLVDKAAKLISMSFIYAASWDVIRISYGVFCIKILIVIFTFRLRSRDSHIESRSVICNCGRITVLYCKNVKFSFKFIKKKLTGDATTICKIWTGGKIACTGDAGYRIFCTYKRGFELFLSSENKFFFTLTH